MAGFDFTFRCSDVHKPLGRILLRRLQELATNFDLELRYKATGSGWYITVDGPLPSMQALIQPMLLQLLPLADGVPMPRSRSQRRRIAHRLVNAYCDGEARIREMIQDIAHRLGGTPTSYLFNEGKATHLSGQVREFERSLILFHNGLMSASTFAEEAHSLSEEVLKAILPRSQRRGSYAELLGRVAGSIRLAPEYKQSLLSLKDRRKMAKHHGKRVSHAEMAADVGELIAAFQFLFRHLQRRGKSEPPNQPIRPTGSGGS